MKRSTLEAMLKWSRKVLIQRKRKPIAQQLNEFIGVVDVENREASQIGQCALAHEKEANNDADFV